MLSLLPGLYLRVVELEGARAPHPLPLASGFSTETAYLALGLFSPSETSEAYVILTNDRDEVWFISNRHPRAVGVWPASTALRRPLASLRSSEGDGQASPAPTLAPSAPAL